MKTQYSPKSSEKDLQEISQGGPNEDQDEHEGRQRSLGRIVARFPPKGWELEPKRVRTAVRFRHSDKGADTMKIKTSTKAGSAVWGG